MPSTSKSKKKNWEDLTPEEKKTGIIAAIVFGVIILAFTIGIVVSVRNNFDNPNSTTTVNDTTDVTNENNSQPEESETSKVDKKLVVMNIADDAIASSADGGYCFAEYIEPDESTFASVASMGTAATYYFVESAKDVFASGNCDIKYTFAYSMNGESSRGGTSKFTLGTFAITPAQFEVYNWSSLSGTSVGESLQRNGILNIPANVRSQIDYEDFRYRG